MARASRASRATPAEGTPIVSSAHLAAGALPSLSELEFGLILLGLLVSCIVVFRLRFLERRSDEAECQMRELSQRLVNAQEEERKNLSRELHDHVAQVLTGLRMELGRLDRLTAPMIPPASAVVAGCKELVDDMFRTVRDLALGLRPSMLDDFGLQAALEWHVRDFTGRYAVAVDLKTQGDFDSLPDQSGPHAVAYGPGPQRFAGATYDPTSHYRAARVFRFFGEQGLTPELLHASYRHQLEVLERAFDALGLPGDVISRDRATPRSGLGGFLALDAPDASGLQAALRERGVSADSRGRFLRLGPAPYLSDRQLETAVGVLGEVVRDVHRAGW